MHFPFIPAQKVRKRGNALAKCDAIYAKPQSVGKETEGGGGGRKKEERRRKKRGKKEKRKKGPNIMPLYGIELLHPDTNLT